MADKLKKLVSGLSKHSQQLEYLFYNLAGRRLLVTAEAAQLDEIGRIVGEFPRPIGITDAEYRVLILIRIELNASKGEPETLIKAIKKITGGDVSIIESFPAAVIASTTGQDLTIGVSRLIDQMAPAGVALSLVQTTDNPLVWEIENGIPGNVGSFLSEEVFEPISGGQISEEYI